jgi:hypothetical protein
MTVKTKMFAVFAMLSSMLVTGCASLGKLLTPTSAPIIQAAVDVAVATAVGNNPADQKVKALAIKMIAQQVVTIAQNPTTTIAALEAVLNAKVQQLAPNPADAAAFMILTSTLESMLQQKIQASPAGPINAQTVVVIVDVANMVLTATSFYGV